ncbi:MAG: beta strand repeat-containing protein [Myxococcaceae bacterium]
MTQSRFFLMLLGLLVACDGRLLAPPSTNRFTLGGTVSGLGAGVSVALRTNRGDQVLVASNGPFTFAETFPDDFAYAVSVETQPAGQICTASNALGTLSGANVSSVVVTCTNSNNGQYTVGGTVSGLLVGTSLVLQNNGGDNLTVSMTQPSGPFTFATTLTTGAAYAVTVLTQPLGQTCAVSNGTGTISNASITNILVTCSAINNPTYTVGGSVSGLGSGSAVVLQNNGGNNLNVLANGTFTFTGALASGLGYSVTVLTQPPGESCVVSNGSGTIAGADITNVSVVCAPIPPQTVGGSVSGLGAGRSVVLQNNGVNNTAVSGNGPFTFSAAVASGSMYSVTVRTQPAGQQCTVSNGSGTVGSTNITDVSVTCVNIAPTTGGLDPTFGGGAGFGVHDNAAGGNGGDVAQSIAIDGQGRIVAAGWSADAAGTPSMALWRHLADGSLDTSFNGVGYVTHAGVGSGGFAQTIGGWVGIDSSNRIVVVGWSNAPDNSSWGACIWRYNPDGTPDTSFNGTGFVRDTSILGYNNGIRGAIDSSDRILVAGFVYNASATSLDMAVWRFNPDGTADTSFNGVGLVSNDGAAGGSGEDVAAGIVLDGSGNVVVTGYSTSAGGDHDMTVLRYLPNGTLDTSFNGTGIFTHHNAGGAAGNDVGHNLTIDGSGRILVTGWSPSTASGDDMTVWRLTSAGALDTSFNGVGYFTHAGASGGTSFEEGRSVRVDASGRILIAGVGTTISGTQDAVIWRLTSAGALDTSFGGGFISYDGYASGDDEGRTLIIDTNGNYLMSGFTDNAAGNHDASIWRILP